MRNGGGISPTNLDGDLLLGVTAQIPAWGVAEMREQRVNAGLIRLIPKDVLSLVPFFLNRVEAAYGKRAESIAIGPYPIAQGSVVAGKDSDQQKGQHQNCDENYALHR